MLNKYKWKSICKDQRQGEYAGLGESIQFEKCGLWNKIVEMYDKSKKKGHYKCFYEMTMD